MSSQPRSSTATALAPGGTHTSGNFPELPHLQLHPTLAFLIVMRFTTQWMHSCIHNQGPFLKFITHHPNNNYQLTHRELK